MSWSCLLFFDTGGYFFGLYEARAESHTIPFRPCPSARVVLSCPFPGGYEAGSEEDGFLLSASPFERPPDLVPTLSQSARAFHALAALVLSGLKHSNLIKTPRLNLLSPRNSRAGARSPQNVGSSGPPDS